MPQKPVILVVDDDTPTLVLMRRVLQEFGFEPITVNAGGEAVETARRETPALVLLDRNMPGMSGDEVIRALRAEPRDGRLPILILSGERLSSSDLRELDADGAVLKPFDLNALIDEIRRHLN
jgi:two-component system phosphate regulon response regulator PhoB/two-component system alkaline phosphatase synthesis response regulator PhoP